jgi:hypothetical protein
MAKWRVPLRGKRLLVLVADDDLVTILAAAAAHLGAAVAHSLVALGGLPERDALALLQACRDLGILLEVSRVLGGTRRIGFM